MEILEAFLGLLGVLISLALIAFSVYFFYCVFKFIVFVPKYLKRIAESLEKIELK